jgi:hypothetical protein
VTHPEPRHGYATLTGEQLARVAADRVIAEDCAADAAAAAGEAR